MGKSFRELVNSGEFDKTIYNNWVRDVNSAQKSYDNYRSGTSSNYNKGYVIYASLFDSLKKRGENIRNMISSGTIRVDNDNSEEYLKYLSSAKKDTQEIEKFYNQFENEDQFYDWSYANKYSNNTGIDIDAAIDRLKKDNSDDNQREIEWLIKNRDSYLTTDELKSAIKELESKSTGLKSDKWKSGINYIAGAIGAGLSGQGDAERQLELKNAKNKAKSAETENSEKLDRYKKLLAQREDVGTDELENMYREADAHSILDVFRADYTYADYANDKSDKRIYGSAYTQRKDAQNSEIIKANADEFDADVSKIETIIYNKTGASALASSSVGGSLADALNPGLKRKEIMATDPEIQSIVRKWADMGYDFNELFETYKKQGNAVFTQSQVDEKAKYATEHPVLSNIESVGTNLIGGVSALSSAFSAGLEDLVSDDVVSMDTNSPEWTLKNVTDAIRNTTAENLSNSEYGALKSFLYQTGMSTADFLTTAVVTGFAEPATLVLMGSNAAVDTMKNVTNNGGSASDAMIMGVLSGVFEAICEKVSVETVFKSIGTTSGKSWLYNLFKGMVSEGSEELATDLMNTTVDILLNADQSEFKQNVYAYMRDGLSAAEASAKVFADNAKNMALSFAGGALSGGVMAGGGGAIGLASANRMYKETGANVQSHEGGTDAVMELAREIVAQDQDTDNTISRDLNKAEKKSNAKNVGKLYADVQANLNSQTQTAAKNEAINGIKDRVEELGLDSSTSNKAAEIIYKAYTGENLTARQKSILDKNKYVARAYRELMASESEEGRSNYSNEWTEKVRNNVLRSSAEIQSKALSIEKYSYRNTETKMSAEEEKNKAATISSSGESVTVNKIVDKTENGFIAELTNGDEVYIGTDKAASKATSELDTVSFTNDDMNRAIVYASNYESVETANAFLKAAATVENTETKNTATLQKGFNQVYLQGLRGEKMNTKGLNITAEQANLAYISGTEDAKLSQRAGGGRVDGMNLINTVKENSYSDGVTRLDTEGELTKKQDAQLKVLDAYGKKHGISFVIVDSIGSTAQKANGAYIGENKIMISLRAEGGALLSYAGHEVYHYIKRNNSADAEAIRAWVIDRLKKDSNYNYDERFKQLSEQYGTEDVEAIEEEITANAMFEVLNNEETINELANENPSLLKKIIKAIKNFIAELKDLMGSLPWAEAKALQDDVQSLEAIRMLFNQALNNTNKNTAREDGGVKYSLNEYSKHQRENWKNSKRIVLYESDLQFTNFINNALSDKQFDKKMYFGTVASDFASEIKRSTDIDVSGYNCSLSTNEIRKIFKDHGDEVKENNRGQRAITIDDIVNVPNVIQTADDIKLSPNTYNGKPVINFIKTGNERITVSAVVSDKHLDLFIQTTFVNIKKESLATPIGEQAPINTPKASSGTASNNRIAQNDSDVNKQYMQNGEKNSPKYSLSEANKIYPGMHDSERADVLKNTVISIAQYAGNKELSGKSVLRLKSSYNSEAGKILRNLGEKFEVFKKYSNENIELEFNYSRGSLNESVHKQGDISTNFYDFAKMLYVFDEVVKNAVPIEVHSDKYKGTERANPNLKYDYVLLSAFSDGEYVTPVEFHIKEFNEKAKDQNKLYVSITLGKIKIENKVKVQVAENQNTDKQWRNTRLFSEISIPQLISKINPEYGNFYKYIPSELLNKEQNASKKVASEDEEYRLKVMRGEDVSDMLAEKASEKGYNSDTSWRMDHKAPNAKDDVCITNIDRVYGGDGSIYSSKAAYYYGDGSSYDQKAINAIKKARNSPEALITIYRAVPNSIKDSRVRNGDWVSIDREYAEEHGWRMFDDDYRIIENKVPAKYLFSDGNSIHEFGYDNGNKNEVYKNTENNVKLNEVTYDDNGNLIPLSKRFDESKPDIRFSLQETAQAGATREQLLKENDNLRVANNVLRNELKLTKGKTISILDAQSLARNMIREFSSDYDSQVLAKKLYDIFRWYDSEDGNADYVVDYIATVAKDVIARSSARDTSLYDEYEDARKWIRNMRFTLPEHVLRQLNENHDGKFRQKTFGKMQLVSKEKNPDVMYLSAMYSELADAYPNFFSTEDNEYEQPQKLLDFWEAVTPTYADVTKEMGFESEEAAAVGFAYMTFEKYLYMPSYQTFADRKQKEIDSLKKEYSRNLNEAKKKLREERDAKVEETKQYYRDMIDRQRVRRMETQAKAALRKDVITKVKKLSDMLTKPTDKKHIPDQLKNMIAKYLMLFTDDSAVFSEAVITRVTKAYTQLIEKDDRAMEGIRQYYDPDILIKLGRLAEIAEAITDGNRLAKLDAFDMNTIAEITDHFYHLVTNANEVFIGEKKKDFNDIITSVMGELHSQKSKAVRASFEATSWNMTPYYFFKKIGGMFNELFTDLLDGQHKYGLLMDQAREHMQELGEKYKISSWQGSKKAIIEFIAGNGEEVKLTADEALGIYAIAKREAISGQESKHLTEGGIVFKGKEAIPVSYEEITRITNALTKEQLAYADEAIEYLSTVVGGWGNEASLKMFGYKKFTESWYYPFHTAEDYKKDETSDNGKTPKVVSLIKNKSFTKSTIHGANTPVRVENFTDVVGNHIAEMISYNTMAQTQSTMNAVFRYKVGNNSVRAALGEAYGTQAKFYVDTLIEDITNGSTSDPHEKLLDKVIGESIRKFKMNAVAANLSVIVQQPSAVGRAFALVDPKYFFTKSPKNGYEECKKYSGVAVIKEIGGFDTSTGKGNADWIMKTDPDGIKNKAVALVKDSDYRSDKLSWAAGKADELTWALIWQAVKGETADKLKVNVNELTEKQLYDAGKRFNEVIEATQVYDSVLTRSQFMRGKSNWTKMASAFMAEPTKRINMLYDAFYEFTVNKNKDSGKYLMRTMGSVLAATVINITLKSLITAGRDDDENQAYAEKYVEAVIDNAFSELSILQGLPIIKDIVSMMQGHDITRTDMEIIATAVSALESFVNLDSNKLALLSDEEKKERITKAIENTVSALGAFIGLPAYNVWRDCNMLIRVGKSVADDKVPTSSGLKYSALDGLINAFYTKIGSPFEELKVNEKDLYKNMVNDDEAAFAENWDKYQAYLIYTGKTEDKAYKAVKSKVKEQIKINLFRNKLTDEEAERYLIEYLGNEDGYWVVKEWRFNAIDENKDISFSKYLELEKAVLAGEDITDKVKELTDHNTKESSVQSKVTSIIQDAFNNDEITEGRAQELLQLYKGFASKQSMSRNILDEDKDINRLVDSWVGNKDLPEGEYYTAFDDLEEAVIEDMSIENAKEKLYSLEYTDSDINQKIRDAVKEAMLDGTLTKAEASSRLMKYTDIEYEDAQDKIAFWNFQKTNPESKLSETGAVKYLEAKESGVSLEVFEDYYSKVTTLTSDKDANGKTITNSKKVKILKLIDSLPLSSKQKDVLYYQNGYSSSRLYEAPWH